MSCAPQGGRHVQGTARPVCVQNSEPGRQGEVGTVGVRGTDSVRTLDVTLGWEAMEWVFFLNELFFIVVKYA